MERSFEIDLSNRNKSEGIPEESHSKSILTMVQPSVSPSTTSSLTSSALTLGLQSLQLKDLYIEPLFCKGISSPDGFMRTHTRVLKQIHDLYPHDLQSIVDMIMRESASQKKSKRHKKQDNKKQDDELCLLIEPDSLGGILTRFPESVANKEYYKAFIFLFELAVNIAKFGSQLKFSSKQDALRIKKIILALESNIFLSLSHLITSKHEKNMEIFSTLFSENSFYREYLYPSSMIIEGIMREQNKTANLFAVAIVSKQDAIADFLLQIDFNHRYFDPFGAKKERRNRGRKKKK